jgi:hypothetical protein
MESLLRWRRILGSHVVVKVAEEMALMECAYRNMNVMKLNPSLCGRKGYSQHSSCCKSWTLRKQSELLQIWRRFSPLCCGIKNNPATCFGSSTGHLRAVYKNIDCRCKFYLFIFLYIYIYLYIHIYIYMCVCVCIHTHTHTHTHGHILITDVNFIFSPSYVEHDDG